MTEPKRTKTFLADYKPTPYRIGDISLDISIDATRTRVHSRLSIEPNPQSDDKRAPLILNGEELELASVELNGKPLKASEYEYAGNLLRIAELPAAPFTLEIVNFCNPSANTALSGLYRSNGVYCTQCEAEGFRRIAFAYDRPDAMATYRVRIEADKAECPVLLSNGNPIEEGSCPDGKRHFATWHDPHPKPTYLFALVAGNLATVASSFVTSSGRSVQLGIHVEPGKQDRCDFAMQALKDSMAWDERRFGREYDLDVFNIVAISDFNMGAMENKGLNIFNDKYILALPETATDQDYVNIESIIAHEYFHNWTGNRITCRDWFQLCLKEGLTVFRDQEFTSDMRSRAVARIADVQTLRSRQYPEDAGPLAHPPRPSAFIEISNFYTPTVYEKGAEICRMLQTLLGDTLFRKGMDLYFERHDGEASTVEQFVACFADVSGRDLGQFFGWYEQAGTPKVQVQTHFDKEAGAYSVTLNQRTDATPGQPDKKPQHIPLALGLLDDKGRDLPLKLDGAGVLNHPIIELREESRTFRFTGLKKRPVLSLNRTFSAPVILETDQTPDDRLFLMAHDSDGFNRWEAGQAEATRLFENTVLSMTKGSALPDVSGFGKALGQCLADVSLEEAFRAQMLSLPGEDIICAALKSDIDTDIVHAARRHVRAALSRSLAPLLENTFNNTMSEGPYKPSASATGQRLLHSAALALLTVADPARGQELIRQELERAKNMTAEIGALTAALQLPAQDAEAALAHFYEKHQHDHLLVDKWFGLMASIPGNDASRRIARLLEHPDFRLTTPNRVYAVIGSFASGNLSGFHAADGSGYNIVAETILELDPVNPQVAARMATSFRTWKLMDEPRRRAARAALEGIVAQPNLSADSFEIVTKMLA